MLKLVMMKGLPGSGKSTYARKLVDKGYVRVNKDDLRMMLNNGSFSKANEKLVQKIEDEAVRAALSSGRSVVVDNTHFNPKHAQRLLETATGHNATFEEVFLDTPLEDCIKNDLKRDRSVGEKVIRRMYNQYLRQRKDLIPLTGGPTATLCDIDGTLAHMGDRSPYDWKRVGEDTLDPFVHGMLSCIRLTAIQMGAKHKIILLSGRDESCREETEQWLKDNVVPYDKLYMRKSGDTRRDYIIKKEIYDKHIKDIYSVNGVFDDRDQVVEMWRNEGLKVFQVQEGDF